MKPPEDHDFPQARHTAPGFRRAFRGDALAVRDALCEAVAWLCENGIAESDRGGAEIVLAEVLNNIAEHAYADAPPGKIELEIGIQPDRLTVAAHDWGRPMPAGGPPPGAPQDLDVPETDLPEGGFGWFLIRELTRALCYRREDGHNLLTFQLPRGEAAGGN